MTAEPIERTVVDIDRDLAAAKSDLSAAESVAASASNDVTAGREAFSLEQITRRALHVLQRTLANRQEEVEIMRAKVRAREKLSIQAHERADAAAQRAEVERAALLRADGARIAAHVGVALRTMEGELHRLWAAVDAHNAALSSWSPATDFYRERAWSQAAESLRGLRSQYPVPASEGAPSA